MKKLTKTKGFSYFIESLWYNNPIFGMILGICSALAVTTKLVNAFVMGVSVIVVLTISSTIVSLIRKLIPERIRIITFMVIIATFVIMIDFILKIKFPDISRSLGPYVGLIITNCVLMGRAEAFSIKQPPHHAFVDALGAGMGYTISILIIAAFRELLGAGTLFGFTILGKNWTKWSLISIPSGAFFVLGFYIMIVNSINKKLGINNK